MPQPPPTYSGVDEKKAPIFEAVCKGVQAFKDNRNNLGKLHAVRHYIDKVIKADDNDDIDSGLAWIEAVVYELRQARKSGKLDYAVVDDHDTNAVFEKKPLLHTLAKDDVGKAIKDDQINRIGKFDFKEWKPPSI